eukprot:TRINITY_DN15496_c0_g3_i1.p4 TRINITY_DN15496_c0_g3~~TRINITY_DN15496_c0_g3_i1.p4  ORF type:complete len:207 (+),score=-12.20 TRINITY_DN15496_c0_g3_i1:544-1164(+)
MQYNGKLQQNNQRIKPSYHTLSKVKMISSQICIKSIFQLQALQIWPQICQRSSWQPNDSRKPNCYGQKRFFDSLIIQNLIPKIYSYNLERQQSKEIGSHDPKSYKSRPGLGTATTWLCFHKDGCIPLLKSKLNNSNKQGSEICKVFETKRLLILSVLLTDFNFKFSQASKITTFIKLSRYSESLANQITNNLTLNPLFSLTIFKAR